MPSATLLHSRLGEGLDWTAGSARAVGAGGPKQNQGSAGSSHAATHLGEASTLSQLFLPESQSSVEFTH